MDDKPTRDIYTKPNFIEVEKVSEANRINLDDYTFVKFSDVRNRYISKLRSGKK
jgi:hypothetical protein